MEIDLKILLPTFRSLKDIGTHKGLAKIGDAVTNLIYSIVKSNLQQRIDARNVNRTILSIALKNAEMKQYARVRADSHSIADTAEAFIGYVYCQKIWSIEELASILLTPIQQKLMDTEKQEIALATEAFTFLLLKIKEKILPLFLEDHQ